MATVPLLAATMARAVTLADADFVVDLSGVEFMDASTVGAIIRTRNVLGRDSRSLVVRSPSPCACRLLDACGLAGLVDRDLEQAPDARSAAALATWVAVPAIGRDQAGADSGRTGTHHRVVFAAAATGAPLGSGSRRDEPRQEGG